MQGFAGLFQLVSRRVTHIFCDARAGETQSGQSAPASPFGNRAEWFPSGLPAPHNTRGTRPMRANPDSFARSVTSSSALPAK
jgi:hypothetical protein